MHVRTQNALKRPKTLFRPPSLPVSQRSVGSFRSSETPTARGILLLSLFFLACAHLAVKTFFPHPAFWLVGAAGIVAAGTWYLLKYNDVPGFFLTLFVCCHFTFADQQGGLWSYVICTVPLATLCVNSRMLFFRIKSLPKSINFLMVIFITHQLLGLLFNNYSTISNIQSLVVTSSQVIFLYACSSIIMSTQQIKRIISVWFFTLSWIFIIAINQKYHWIVTKSPLLPQRETKLFTLATLPSGSFGNSELFSEYFCFIFIFSFAFLIFREKIKKIQLNILYSLSALFFSIFSLLMGGSRSAIILSIFSSFIIIFFYISNATVKNISKNFFIIIILTFCVVITIFQSGKYFSIHETIDDFSKLKNAKISFKSIGRGESINRSTTFEIGFQRLGEKSWWIGYGNNLPENNRESMGVTGSIFSDYHSLYLQLPIFYGWIGSMSYILIVLLTAKRAFLCSLRAINSNNVISIISFIFFILLVAFLLDQYKISATRNPSYFLLTWFLLGLTHAIINSYNISNKTTNHTIKNF